MHIYGQLKGCQGITKHPLEVLLQNFLMCRFTAVVVQPSGVAPQPRRQATLSTLTPYTMTFNGWPQSKKNLYLLGGKTQDGSLVNSEDALWIFVVTSNKWIKSPIRPPARFGHW
jgi:hypothetical protein